MKRTALLTQLPILTSCFFGVYAGGSFVQPTFRTLITGRPDLLTQSNIGWAVLGLLFIIISTLHLIKFVNLHESSERTNLMFIDADEKRVMATSYVVFFILIAALSAFFLVLSLNRYEPTVGMQQTVAAQQFALIILIMVNIVMAMLKLNEKRRHGRKRQVAVNF